MAEGDGPHSNDIAFRPTRLSRAPLLICHDFVMTTRGDPVDLLLEFSGDKQKLLVSCENLMRVVPE